MTEQTIVAVYDKLTDADAAVRDLAAASVPSQAIIRHENGTVMTASSGRGFLGTSFRQPAGPRHLGL